LDVSLLISTGCNNEVWSRGIWQALPRLRSLTYRGCLTRKKGPPCSSPGIWQPCSSRCSQQILQRSRPLLFCYAPPD